MTASQDPCPQCGQPFAAGGVAGLCPACLLRQGATCDTGLPGSFTPPAPEELREWFPQLDILSLIGTGGMGAVYQARQRGLDRFVALKILPPGIGERPGFAERFTREAKALARLSHPGIVTIHDSGRVDGLYYLLMEYVDGLNLRQLMNRGPVSPREALAIVPAICDALQYAHDHGIVHRDIKPENILLDKNGRVKVADFGLAKLVGNDELEPAGDHPPEPLLTGTGHVMGTPQYMAPEQVTSPSEVDHRADIYSLGVVLYQMLTGELPGQALVPPSRKVTIDVRLDEVVLRALEQNPDRRYQQVSEVRNVVETIIHSSNPHPTPPTPMEIKFNCPGCGQKLSVDESASGEEFTCPSCATPFVVPAAGSSPPPPPPIPPAPAMTSPPPMRPPTNFTPLGGEPTRAKAWAIWALVLGIIGIIPILGLATGLIALALGIVALVKKTTSKGVAIAGTVLGALGTLMIPFHLALLTTTIIGAKFGAGTAVCASNMKVIGTAIGEYRRKHGGVDPASLDVLVKEGLLAAKVLQCPLHGDQSHSSYDYTPSSGSGGSGLIVWDRVPHGIMGQAAGRTVLDANLNPTFLTEEQFGRTPKAKGPQPKVNTRPTAPMTVRPGNTVPPGGPTATVPPPQPPPVEEPMTIARALDGLKTAQPREMRRLLQFLKESSVEEAQRADVIAAVKPLLTDVDSGNMAFEVFCQWAGKEEVPDFIEFIRVAPNSARSKESMKLLSRMGDARAAEPLAACLTDFFVVRDAKAALAALGDIAKPVLLPYYHHESRHAREAARELLRGYKATEDELFAVTIQALQSGPAATRQSAIQELTAGQLPPGNQAAACRALRPLVSDSERAVHDGARKAMIALAGPADADFLLGLMTSTDDGLRQFATDLLVKFKDARAAKPLAVLLADSHKTHAAGRSLIALGSAAEPAVIPYLRAEDPNTRKRAAEVLAEIGTSASLSALQPLTRDKNFFAKVAAERAVNAIKARVGAGRR